MTKYTKEEVDDLRRMVLDEYYSQRGLEPDMVSSAVVEDLVRTYIAAGVRAYPRGRSYDLQPHSSQTLTET